MLSKFSVKKPFTVLVGVILVIVLGFVSFTRMSADLLPDINLPYVIVMTTYVGATPETVEMTVSAPVESAMATISNIESIQSMSSENYSVVILEFAQTANMDSVSLEIREKLDQLESYWDDAVGHPIIMKLNPNMLPTMIAAVGMPDMTNAEISDFAESKIIPSIESIEGVASVNATGLIEESLHVFIREDKVDRINERLAELIDEKFEEAYQQIADSSEEIEKGLEELNKAEKEVNKGQNQLNSAKKEIANGKKELNDKKTSTMGELTNAKLQVTTAKADLEAAKTQISTNVQTADGYVTGLKQVNTGLAGVDLALNVINNAVTDLPAFPPGTKVYTDVVTNTIGAYQAAKTGYDGAVAGRDLAKAARDAALSVRDAAKVAKDNAQADYDATLLAAGGNASDPAVVAADAVLATAISDLATAESDLSTAETALATAETGVTTAAGVVATYEPGLVMVKTMLTDAKGAGAVFDDLRRAQIANLDFKASDASAKYLDILNEYKTYLVSNNKTLHERKSAIENQLSGLIGWTVTETYYFQETLGADAGKYFDISQSPRVEVTKADYDNRYKQLEADLKFYKDTQNGVLKTVNDNAGKLDEQIVKLYQGENEAIIQFANGLSQLDLAEYKLTSSEAEIISGKQEIKNGKDKLEEAKDQLEDAVSQIDESKEDALAAADMTGVLTVDTVSALLTAQNFSMPAGYVDSGDDSYLVRIGDKPDSVEELQNLPIMKVPMTDDEVIYLADVADVFATSNIDDVYTNVNGNKGVILSIQKQTGYSTGDVSDKIADRFEDLKEQYNGISLITLMDQGIYIDLVMSSIFENVLIGGLLAIIVLIFFLKDIRPTLVIAISIPISLIAAVVAMYFSGVTLNIISLSGLALGVGMLVDNSIVVIENIYRLRKEGMEIREAAIEGAREVAGAIFASTLTTVGVFLPIVFTEGMTRQLFVDMGLTITYSLLASLLIALTVVPALATGLVRNVKNVEGKTTDTKFYRGYKKFLSVCLKLKPIVIMLAIALLVLSVVTELTRGTAYFPPMESTQISVDVKLAENSKLTNVTAETDKLIEGMMEIPDIVDVGAMASSSSLSMLGGMSTSSGKTSSTSIYVTTKEDRELSSDELAAKIKEIGAGIEGVTVSVDTSTMDMSALGGSGISVAVKGRDLDALYDIAEQVADTIANTEGIAKVSDIKKKSDAEFRITVNKDEAILYGLTVAQVFSQIYPKLQDAKVSTTLSTISSDISVYVESESDNKFDLDMLKDMMISYKDSDQQDKEVPLSEIAVFTEAYSMATINRENQTRVVSVSASLAEGYNIGLVSQDVERNVGKIELPKGYEIDFGGENEQIMDALGQLVLMLVLAVLFIYLIMVAQFQSLLSPFIIMFTIPLAFTGGFAALYLSGNEISIVAMIGFVMLSGVIVNNGIVLVDYINQLRESGLSKKEAILEAGATRLRPVLMTALTTILALLTMAFSNKMGADMTKPLAIAVIGGMIYGTLMTLVVVPCIYDLFIREKKNRDKGVKESSVTNNIVADDAMKDDYKQSEQHVITIEELVNSEDDYVEPESKKSLKAKMAEHRAERESEKAARRLKPEKVKRTDLATNNPYMIGWTK